MIYVDLSQVDTKERSDHHVITRKAARGIAFEGGKILCVKNDLGDYKFPGGGLEENETFEQALYREVLEETGYQLTEKQPEPINIMYSSHP